MDTDLSSDPGKQVFDPNLKCTGGAFTDFDNTTQATSGIGTFAPATLSAGQASTTQILQTLAARREQEKKICPLGYVNESGACVPALQTAQAEAPPASPASGTSKIVGKKPPTGAQTTSADEYQTADLEEFPNNAAWAELSYQHEDRSDIPDGQGGSFERKQNTAGFLSGVERRFKTDGGGVFTFGALAGYSTVQQDFGTVTSTKNGSVAVPVTFGFQDQITDPFSNPTVELKAITGFGEVQFTGQNDPVTNNPLATRILTVSTPLTVSVSTTQKLNGPSVGLYGTYQQGSYFVDLVGKVDVFDLRRNTTTLTTAPTALKSNVFVSSDNGCISKFDLDHNPIALPDELLDPASVQTTSRTEFDRTTDTNLTLAANIGYRVDQPGGWWYEPVVGIL